MHVLCLVDMFSVVWLVLLSIPFRSTNRIEQLNLKTKRATVASQTKRKHPMEHNTQIESNEKPQKTAINIWMRRIWIICK